MSERTLVTFILDKSTSMLSIKEATLEAFNTYLKTLQNDVAKNGGFIDFTLVQFSDFGIERTVFKQPVGQVALLNDYTYQPGGMTPLIDATYNTIVALQTALDASIDKPKVIVCVQTDGDENCSKEHSWGALKELIASKQAAGWQFNFMGAGIDSYKQSVKMGLNNASTMSYNSGNLEMTRTAFAATAMNAGAFRRGEVADTSYSFAQKVGSGDAYDPDLKAGAVGISIGAKAINPTVTRASTTVDLGGAKDKKSDDNLKVTL